MIQRRLQTSPAVVIDARFQADISVSFYTLPLTWGLASFQGSSLAYRMKTGIAEMICACDPLRPVVSVIFSGKNSTSLVV